mmetsp:Transcript_24802/g.43363  ORF Transcript_24802/g.43363 Transcript_24802/m.43363 type:complete len:215 (-) Transcript_24802:352-996(-)
MSAATFLAMSSSVTWATTGPSTSAVSTCWPENLENSCESRPPPPLPPPPPPRRSSSSSSTHCASSPSPGRYVARASSYCRSAGPPPPPPPAAAGSDRSSSASSAALAFFLPEPSCQTVPFFPLPFLPEEEGPPAAGGSPAPAGAPRAPPPRLENFRASLLRGDSSSAEPSPPSPSSSGFGEPRPARLPLEPKRAAFLRLTRFWPELLAEAASAR